MSGYTVIKKHIHYFLFFYSFLKWRYLIIIFFSLIIGALDGIGLAFFIPLLELAFNNETYKETYDKLFLNEIFFSKFTLTPSLFNVVCIILVLFCLKGIIKFLDSYLKVYWQEKITREIKTKNLSLFKNLQYIGFLKMDVGKIQNTLTNELIKISLAYKFYFKTLNFIILVTTYFFISLNVDWRFTTAVIIGATFINIPSYYIFKKTKILSNKLVQQAHLYHKFLSEKVNLYKYLKSTGLLKNYIKKINKNALDIEKTQKELGFVESAIYGFKEPLAILTIFASIFLYDYFFIVSFSNLLLNLLLIYRAFTFFMASQENWNLFLGYSGSINNLENFKNELSSIQEKKEPRKKIINNFTDKIVLKNLSFKYNISGPYVLRDISLEINRNQTVAIVGTSGSGKTTLLNILTGLLEPLEGHLYIDNLNLNTITLSSYRKQIGYIIQDPPIFNDTIYNNVSFWGQKNKENYDKFKNAIQEAKITDFIQVLPKKEDTLLGANGTNLSGGQKQRISIARELFKNPELLFLDEATSALDTITEAEIHKNIESLKGKYTIVIIAHRLATIKNADFIVLMEDGMILEKGTYKELIEKSSSFRKMVKQQTL